MIPSQVTKDLEDTLIPWMLMRSIFDHPAKAMGHRVREMVVSSAVELIIKETALFTSLQAEAMARKINRAIHDPRVLAMERASKVRETENPKENPKVPKVQKVRTRVKNRKLC